MPTVRRRRSRALIAPRIPQEAVDAYRLAREIEEAGAHGAWEDEGGRGREYRDATVRLDSALGIFPHQPGPLAVDGPEPDPELLRRGPAGWFEGWARAWKLRVALEAATDDDGEAA